jgi:hypothetical protein
MKKFKVLTTPTRLADLDLDETYEDDGMNLRAERLHARSWRKLKHQML